MTSDRIDELIASAALGELSESEQRELDEAAASDPIVAAELDEALAAAASLQRAHTEEPPAALRDSLLAAIASTPQEAPVDLPPTAERAPAQVSNLQEVRTRRRFRPMVLGAAAAVALFVAAGVVLVATNDDVSDPTAEVVDAPDATSRQLDGEIDTLSVVYSATARALVVEGTDVPVPDDDATYQLWLVDDDGATSVGVFRPEPDGTVSELFTDADPTGFVLGVTEEPAGGSESPTLPIIASA